MSRLRSLGIAAAVSLALTPIVASVSSAAPGPAAVSVLHGIPGVPVDVYVNDALTLTNFLPKATAGPLELPAGAYAIKVFSHIDNPSASAAARADAAVITKSVDVPADVNASVIANFDNTGTPVLSVFVNNNSPTAAGKARVTVRHTADAPTVDIQVNGADALPNLVYGAEASAELPAGSYDFAVQVSPDGPIAIDIPGVTLVAGQHLVVYAIGQASPPVPSNAAQAIGTLDVITQPFTVGQVAPSTTFAPATPAPTTRIPVVNPAFTG